MVWRVEKLWSWESLEEIAAMGQSPEWGQIVQLLDNSIALLGSPGQQRCRMAAGDTFSAAWNLKQHVGSGERLALHRSSYFFFQLMIGTGLAPGRAAIWQKSLLNSFDHQRDGRKWKLIRLEHCRFSAMAPWQERGESY